MRADLGVLLLRLLGLGLALAHGVPHLIGLYAGSSHFPASVAALGFPAPVVFAWAAASAEVVGGLGVAAGLLTRMSALLAAVPLAVAVFLRHHAHLRLLALAGTRVIPDDTLAAWGSPELALAYLLPMIAVALIGPGRISLDALRRGPRVGKRR